MSRRVLLVEDDKHNLELLKLVLEMKGYEVITAVDGKEAMKILEKTLPDAVLLDLQLPEISGYELAEWMRGQKHLKDITIIAITAYATPEEKEKALKSGCNGYITKPINTRTIDKEIEGIISKHGQK